MLECDSCGCYAAKPGNDWVAYHGDDSDGIDESRGAVFCPPCAAAEFGHRDVAAKAESALAPAADGSSSRRFARWGLPCWFDSVAVAAVSALAGIIAIGRRPLWLDEAFDVQWTHLGWHDYLSLTFRSEMGQAVWLLLLKPWLSIAGHGEVAARAPSVLFAAAACALLVPVGRTLLGGRLAGAAAGLLMACSAFVVFWEQQARTYSLALFASVAVTYLFLRALRSSGWRWWLLYALVGVVAVYTHFFVGLVLVAHAAAALTFRPRPGRPAVYAGFIVVLLALPAAAFAIDMSTARGFIPPLTLDGFTAELHLLAGGRWAVAAAAVAGAVLVAARVDRWKAVLLIGWLVVPIATTAALSISHPSFIARYLIGVVPAASLCGAYLLTRTPRWWSAAAVVATCAWALGPVADWYRSPFSEDWRAAAAYVDTRRAESDHLTVTSDWLTLVSGYYMKSQPDSRTIRGDVTWVVTIPVERYRVDQEIRSRGYVIAVEKGFPSVVILKAVRPQA